MRNVSEATILKGQIAKSIFGTIEQGTLGQFFIDWSSPSPIDSVISHFHQATVSRSGFTKQIVEWRLRTDFSGINLAFDTPRVYDIDH